MAQSLSLHVILARSVDYPSPKLNAYLNAMPMESAMNPRTGLSQNCFVKPGINITPTSLLPPE